MRGTLLVDILTLRSSYMEDREEPAMLGEVTDTLQWWIDARQAFRIRTHTLDLDIRIHRLDSPIAPEIAHANNDKHYGDVIAKRHRFEFEDVLLASQANLGPPGRLVVEAGAFAFWQAGDQEYRTKSVP